ncbi:MAG: hypothetical protein E6356_17975 [Terrisporobacter othiniensis]|nr:hypothetical protein [Terrisporobacter othiniensis]MDU6996742.1 hypothetical protein [Terrisporobacter othiniensis]
MILQEYTILKGDDFCLKFYISDVELDYYTNCKILLYFNDIEYILLNDNVLFIYNVLKQYIENMDNYQLDNRLNEFELGKGYNDYLYTIFENIDNEDIIFTKDGEWIGEKYCCFSTKEYATWIYKFKNSIYLMVTRVFQEFEEDDIESAYSMFINEPLTVFTTKISCIDLENFFKLLTALKTKL